MNEKPWRYFISLFTATSINIPPAEIIASLEKSFTANGLVGPFNTETNAPDNEKDAPVAKIETAGGKVGVWIGDNLIFMPLDGEAEMRQAFAALRATDLGKFKATSYNLSAGKIIFVDNEVAQKSSDASVQDLLQNPMAQEFSKHFVNQISDRLVAKDTITVSRNKQGSGLIVDMSVRAESPETAGGLAVGDLLSQVQTDFKALKAHEDAVRQQVSGILGE